MGLGGVWQGVRSTSGVARLGGGGEEGVVRWCGCPGHPPDVAIKSGHPIKKLLFTNNLKKGKWGVGAQVIELAPKMLSNQEVATGHHIPLVDTGFYSDFIIIKCPTDWRWRLCFYTNCDFQQHQLLC